MTTIPANNDNSAWVFSVLVPNDALDTTTATTTAESFEDETTDSPTPTATIQDDTLIQLRRRPRFSDHVQTTVNKTTTNNDDPEDADASTSSSSSRLDETTSLLTEHGQQQQPTQTTTSQPSRRSPKPLRSASGWTFASPYWTVQSSILLKITYKPAYQVLPSYTNRTCSRNAPHLSQLGISTAACCCSCDCCAATETNFSVTYTTADIQRVQHLERLDIRGAPGPCTGIRLYLKPLSEAFQLNVPANIPQPYQKEWQEQVERALYNRQDIESFVHTMRSDMKTRQQPNEQQQREDNNRNDLDPHEGPVLTFAMPQMTRHDDDEPPLLWKVHIPPPVEGGPIALETLTVMDGPLLQTKNTKSTNNYDPTHIYINGYQSWSFAGSVPLGQPQPTSAMPDFCSKAFNHGGTPPPVSLEYVPPERQQAVVNCPVTAADPYHSDFFTCITCHHDGDQQNDARTPRRRIRKRDRVKKHLRSLLGPQMVHQPLDETGGPALVLGFLSQHEQLGVVTVDPQCQRLQLHASHQGQLLLPRGNNTNTNNPWTVETDWAFCELEAPHTYDEEPLVHYLRAVAAYNHANPLGNGPLLTGWCSWYHYYEHIDEESLKSNFATLASLRTTVPTNVSVVDDGYMTAWGDWNSLKPKKFSSEDSLQTVAQDIAGQKMRPGLWLAPFACDKHSQLAKDHPDWIIRNRQGIPANSANCGKWFYGLDATNPAVLEYVYKCIRRAVHEWGFTVLKIDFLYAACLDGNGKYDITLSRAQAMHLALHTIRAAAGPDVFLIGCGCPIGAGVGYVDGMRISADTGPTWYSAFPFPKSDHGTLPSLRGMIRNSITRAPLGHRWWHNDPDCLMLGSTTKLTLEEVASSASIIALTCGMLLLSDDLTMVSPARLKILTKIFPISGVTAVVLDLHSSTNARGIPTLMRLWCTDKGNMRQEYRRTRSTDTSSPADDDRDHNEEAGYFARRAAYRSSGPLAHPTARQRSCIHVAGGLGTWTVVSISNWLDKPAVVHIPPMALAPPPEASDLPLHGYHAFGFWSSKYSWLVTTPDYPDSDSDDSQDGLQQAPSPTPESSPATVSKMLSPHETEIFHIKPVTPDKPQYIGSDLHFSCGQEVDYFEIHDNSKHRLTIKLRTDYQRVGHIFIFVPIVSTSQVKATSAGEPARWTVIGNVPTVPDAIGRQASVIGRILQIAVTIQANQSESDGMVTLEF